MTTSTKERLRAGACADELATHLDGLEDEARLSEVRALSGRDLAQLYERCAGRPAALEELVPETIEAGVPVRHRGINSLPVFRRFEKRFLRSPDGEAELWGYNEQTMRPLTGPGYFVVPPPGEGEEAGIDYRRVPPRAPDCGWPAVKPNGRGLARLVYGDMVDTMRRVARGVSIGRAHKGGKPFDAWFALVREPLDCDPETSR